MQVKGSINTKKMLKDYQEFARKEIRVGVFGGENAKLARIHEFGAQIPVTEKMRAYLASIGLFLRKETEFITIPERAPLRKMAASASAQKEITKEARESVIEMLTGKITPKQLADRIGLVAADQVRELITEGAGLPPPNHPVTVQQKGSTRPLVDTGELARSYTHQVK